VNQTEIDQHKAVQSQAHNVAVEQEDIAKKLLATLEMLDKNDK